MQDDTAAGLWPGPFGLEAPTPWALSGRQVTAWFTLTQEVIDRYVHPDLRPRPADTYPSRARFYTLEVDGERFHEAAISLPIRVGDVDGEASALLWGDSERYCAWARDGFGWTVVPATFDCSGSLWQERSPAGGTGRVTASWGGRSLVLEIADPVVEEAASGGWMTRLPWLAPRRIVHRAGLDGETREVFKITPTMRRPGTRFAGQGILDIDFGPHDPLSTQGGIRCDLEVIDDFEIVVGEDVEIVTSEQIGS